MKRRRGDSGIGILEVGGLILLLSVMASGAYFQHLKNKGKNPLIGGAQDATRLNDCLKGFPLWKSELETKFPPNVDIPLDDPDYKAVIACKNDISRILTQNAEAAANQQWKDLLTQLNAPIENAGACTFKITFPKTKPAGKQESVGLEAHIPLSNQAVTGAVVASTGETDTLTRKGEKSLEFDGFISLDGRDKAGGTPVTLTLTPTGPVSVPCPPAVFTWTDPPPYVVTLNPPAGGTNVTTPTVSISGTVVPAPPAPTFVALEVNGKSRFPALVEGDGSFTANVDLEQVADLSDVILTNPGRTIVACGNATSRIFLRNNKNPLALTNFVSASVVAASGRRSNTAVLSISHVVEVQKVNVSWVGGRCPGAPETLPAGQIVAGAKSVDLGTVKCGFPCPSHGVECESTARVDIETSVGSTYTEAPWEVNIE